MSKISSFSDSAHVVVAGANGGIGAAFVDALLDDPRVGRVTALSRNRVAMTHERLRSATIDFADEVSIATAAEECAASGDIDLVIVATGILHRDPDIRPEKRLADLDGATLAEVLHINTIGPALLAKHFLPLLRRDAKSAFAAISARVGSISDNRLGGWASYRASKAALNMLLRTFSIEHSRTNANSLVVALHPGTTDTALSEPFQRNVPEGKLFTPAFTAGKLLAVLDGLTPEDSGGFFAWDGSPIEY
jgi:NAD(P)-dependent dehydrogenase (short-subunit alcohol dehydrogenase family)